jgi:hypothetical protein
MPSNPAHFFYPNALKRYALGTKNNSLKYNDDGGLTIYLEQIPIRRTHIRRR